MLCHQHGNKGRKCLGNFNLRHPSKNAASVRWSIAQFIRIITILHRRRTSTRSFVAPTVVFSRRTPRAAMLSDCRRRHRHRHRATTESDGILWKSSFYRWTRLVLRSCIIICSHRTALMSISACRSVFPSVQFFLLVIIPFGLRPLCVALIDILWYTHRVIKRNIAARWPYSSKWVFLRMVDDT